MAEPEAAYECELTDVVDLNDEFFSRKEGNDDHAARGWEEEEEEEEEDASCFVSIVFENWLYFWKGARGWAGFIAIIAAILVIIILTAGYQPPSAQTNAGRVFFSIFIGVPPALRV